MLPVYAHNFSQFTVNIEKSDYISEFSFEVWTALVESVAVKAKDNICFNFRNGMRL